MKNVFFLLIITQHFANISINLLYHVQKEHNNGRFANIAKTGHIFIEKNKTFTFKNYLL